MTSIEIMAHAIAERFARDGGFCGIEAGKEFAYDIRKALEEAGFAIVPVEQTPEMKYAAHNAGAHGYLDAAYKAMLQVAKAKP